MPVPDAGNEIRLDLRTDTDGDSAINRAHAAALYRHPPIWLSATYEALVTIPDTYVSIAGRTEDNHHTWRPADPLMHQAASSSKPKRTRLAVTASRLILRVRRQQNGRIIYRADRAEKTVDQLPNRLRG